MGLDEMVQTCRPPGTLSRIALPVYVGSHLDTQPTGAKL